MDRSDISSKIKPPTHRALMATLQFLADSFPRSFETLLEESGEKYDTTVLPHKNALLTALDAYQETLDAEATAEDRAEKRRIDESMQALATSSELPVSTLLGSHDYVHASNVIALDLSFDPEKSLVATGSTDKLVKVTDYKKNSVVFSSDPLPSPVLSVAFNPVE